MLLQMTCCRVHASLHRSRRRRSGHDDDLVRGQSCSRTCENGTADTAHIGRERRDRGRLSTILLNTGVRAAATSGCSMVQQRGGGPCQECRRLRACLRACMHLGRLDASGGRCGDKIGTAPSGATKSAAAALIVRQRQLCLLTHVTSCQSSVNRRAPRLFARRRPA